MVYQINNAKDSTLLWNSLSLAREKETQEHLTIQPFYGADSLLYFSAYIWNKGKEPFDISDVEALLHTPKTKFSKKE